MFYLLWIETKEGRFIIVIIFIYFGIFFLARGIAMGKFVIGSSVDGYRFLVESFKGEVLAMSPFYDSEEKATEAIKLVKILIPNVKVYDETKGGHVLTKTPRFVIYRDSNDMYHFSLEDGDAISLLSSPAYTSFGYCVQMISNLRSI